MKCGKGRAGTLRAASDGLAALIRVDVGFRQRDARRQTCLAAAYLPQKKFARLQRKQARLPNSGGPEEHTSEPQSRPQIVCPAPLEKNKRLNSSHRYMSY